MSDYLFDNVAEQTSARFSVLESRYDPFSRAQLQLTGLAQGWRCLEVGGGGGSLGIWLGERVGPGGEVVITDIEPRWARSRRLPANVRLVLHDITRDPLPWKDFDLIHARLVLLHLPQRLEVLDRLVAALRPGGWLVLDEFDCGWVPVLSAPNAAAAALFEHVHAALMRLLSEAGADPLWGRRVVGAMMRAGLRDVSATAYAESWQGGGAAIDLHRANVEQVAQRMVQAGVTEHDLTRFRGLLEDPAFVVNSYPLVSARGRRDDPNSLLTLSE